MQIEFDSHKRDKTLAERGLDFARSDEVFAGVNVTFRDNRIDYGEQRFNTVGVLDARMVVIAWTLRGEVRRIISMMDEPMSENKRVSASWVDPDDAPDLSEADLSQGVWRVGEHTVKQQEGVTAMHVARRGRPKAAVTKEPVKLRLDADVLAALRSSGDGWQTRINDMLRASLHLAGRV